MSKSISIPSLLALLAAAAAARAQSGADVPEEPATAHHRDVHAAFAAWNAAHGGNWRLHYDVEVGAARFVFGGALDAPFVPHSDAELYSLAREALADTAAIHRIEASTLIEDQVSFVPLGVAGSTDKQSVQLRQAVNGVPVIHGFANVLFDMRGRTLSIDTTALPDVAGLPTSAAISAQRATQIAAELFAQDARLPVTRIADAELAIDAVPGAKELRPVLVWCVDVGFDQFDMEPVGYEYRIDAQTGALSTRHATVHHDVSGNVASFATPGNYPDSATNPPQALAMPAMTITSSSGNTTTNVNGDFLIAGASAPLTINIAFTGPWAVVNDSAGSPYSLSPSLSSASGNSVVMNTPAAPLVTAQANAFLATTLQRFWTTSINPTDLAHDFQAVANVNLSSTCNAYYNGISTNYFQAGGGCVNTAYCDIVLHETGHWMNDRYSSFNGPDGFGEGNADNFATYFTDDPILGHDFAGPGTYVRSGLNNRQFCGDTHPGCYGEVHADGEVLMGACWKVRARLKAAHGTTAGGVIANSLFNSWMVAFNDGQIRTIIEKHWLVLDDNDGNLQNGTPNFAHIHGGFTDQGFDLPPFVVTHTPLSDTQNQAGPYVVNATLVPEFSTQTLSATLHYRVNGGSYTSVAMTNTGGNAWSANIPGQNCTSFVDYYLTAVDGNNFVGVHPYRAPGDGQLHFAVANIVPIVTEDFEGGVGGWTHAQVIAQDDWHISSQFPVNISYGKAGDPTVPAVSGQNIWGNDLGPNGFNGYYSANVSNYLRSPAFDCTGQTGVLLKFNRWLTVEKSQYDQAQIKVNGNVVWTNPFAADLLDSTWTPVVVDISAFADNNPSVQIEFSLITDAGLQYGGWNIDDVQLIQYAACSSCPAPTPYCTAKTTSLGALPVVDSTGTPSLAANNFAVRLSNAPPMRQTICFWGDTTGATPYTGGFNCVGLPFHRLTPMLTDATGSASVSIPIVPAMVGTQRHYQWWFRDPPDPYHVGLSGGLSATFCN